MPCCYGQFKLNRMLKYLVLIYIVIFFAGLISCETPNPNFNPFIEDHPDLSVEKILNDTTLKMEGDCMAFRYSKNFGAYNIFYIIYSLPDEIRIEGKGLEIPLKKGLFILQDDLSKGGINRALKIDSILRNVEIDSFKVNSILNIYGLTKTKEMVLEDALWDIQLKKYYWLYKNLLGDEYLFEKVLDVQWLSEVKGIGTLKIVYDSRLQYETNKIKENY